jgi:hypothetical protein
MKTIIDWKSNSEYGSFFQMVGVSQNTQYIISKSKGDNKFLLRIYDNQKDKWYFSDIETAKKWCETLELNKN